MPIYTLSHILPLTQPQKDSLASSITNIHAEKFGAPRLFVNVVFEDVGAGDGGTGGTVRYVAGKRKTSNQIVANVRHGPSRTQAMYNELCSEITAAWNDVVNDTNKDNNTSSNPSTSVPTATDRELRAIFILGDIVAGSEAGFPLPEAGKDREWIRENMEAFRRKAEEGDEEFGELVEEVERRGMV